MTKKIVKRTDANNETLYFYTHSDAVDVGEGSSTKSLTEVIDDTLHKSAQTLTNAEKTQVYANLGLNGVDDVPTDNSNNLVKSGGVHNSIVNAVNSEKERAELAEQVLQDNIDNIKDETLEENRQMVNSIMENYAPVEITGDVNNAADEEDLTSVNVEGIDVLKFKDKVYNPLVYSGLGRKILRKNIVNGVNTFTKEMMSDANTIYHIQYDYDLNGQTITVPEGCTLEFEGGSMDNGTLIGQNTVVNSQGRCFKNGITLVGFHSVKAKWVGIVPGDCTEAFKIFARQSLRIEFDKGVYMLKLNDFIMSEHTELIGCSDNRLETEIRVQPLTNYEFILGLNYYSSIKNLTIRYILNNNTNNDGIIVKFSNLFKESYTSPSGDYASKDNYTIDNVIVRGEPVNKSYDGSQTAFWIETMPYKDGELTNARALSYFQHFNFVHIKNVHVGVRLKMERPSGTHTWQNSVYFTNIVIEALIGIWFDRTNGAETSYSTGQAGINNYVFQGYHETESYGIYGFFRHDRISNYVSWDNQYLGRGYGNLDADFTAMTLTSQTAARYDSNLEVVNGYLQEEGKTLIVNKTAFNVLYFGTKTAGIEHSNFGKIDFREANTIHTICNINSIYAGSVKEILPLSYPKLYEKCIYWDNTERANDTPLYRKQLSSSTNPYSFSYKLGYIYRPDHLYCYLAEAVGSVILSGSGIGSRFLRLNNYGYLEVETVPYVPINKVDGTVYKLCFLIKYNNTIPSEYVFKTDENGNPVYLKTFIKKLSVVGGTLLHSIYNDATGELYIYVRYNEPIVNNSAAQNYTVSFDIKLSPGTYTNKVEDVIEWNKVAITLPTKTALFLSKGTTANRPAEELGLFNALDLSYYDTNISKYIKYNGTKWIESDNATAGVLRSGTFANKPAATDIYVGFKYFCTDKQTAEGQTNGIEIIHKGNDVWVDALGRVVS